MKTNLPTLAVLTVLLASLTGCQTASLPEDVTDAIEHGDVVELVSVDPAPLKGGKYYGWIELGRTAITSAETRAEIVDSLNDAISSSDGTVAGCFNPRHAVFAKHNGIAFDVIICFECMSLSIRKNGKTVGSQTISRQQASYFNGLLKAANLPIAE